MPVNYSSDNNMSQAGRTYSEGDKTDKPNDENESMIKKDLSNASDGDKPSVPTLSFLTIKLNPGVSIKNIIALFIAYFV